MKNKNKGFTIIEIIIALAIIGVLSAIVATNLQGVKDKARINKALQFSQGLYASFGSNTTLYLDFENISGFTVLDKSESKNNGTLLNGASEVSSLLGSGINFDGINDYIDFNFSFFDNPKSQFTVAFWIFPNTTSGIDQIILHNLENGEFKIGYDSSGKLFFAYNGSNSGWQRFDSKKTLATGKWYHIAVNWDEKNNISQIFIDGTSRNIINPGESLASQTGNPTIGAQRQTSSITNNFNGVVDDIRIYNWD